MTGTASAPRSVTADLLGPLLTEPHLPRLTWYAADGGRTELSTASLANWSAKVAGLLVDELGARHGDTVYVALPAGWPSAPILLGAWWAGLLVTDQDDPDAVAAFVPDGRDPAVGAADEVFVVSGHPLGAASRSVAAHQRDFSGAVLPQADRFAPGAAVGSAAGAITGTATLTVGAVLELARAAGSAVGAGARVLSGVRWTSPAAVIPVLLGVLSAAGSLVQLDGWSASGPLTGDRLAALAGSERVDRTLGVEVPGVSAATTGP